MLFETTEKSSEGKVSSSLNPISESQTHLIYNFNFLDSNDFVNLSAIGREKQTLQEYYWDGLTRKDLHQYIFQYTISGYGILEVESKKHILPAGKAFLVKTPSDHKYYLPKESNEWEFLFITLSGPYTEKCWNEIIESTGSVYDVPADSTLVKTLLKIYKDTSEGNIADKYSASARAYEFLMECYRHTKNYNKKENVPPHISKALAFIHASFHEPYTIQEIALNAGVTNCYFIKQFSEYLNTTPKKYITKLRLQYAINLLQNTELTIQEIAVQSGYSNDNYFYKVFKKIMGLSPGDFRQEKRRATIDHKLL